MGSGELDTDLQVKLVNAFSTEELSWLRLLGYQKEPGRDGDWYRGAINLQVLTDTCDGSVSAVFSAKNPDAEPLDETGMNPSETAMFMEMFDVKRAYSTVSCILFETGYRGPLVFFDLHSIETERNLRNFLEGLSASLRLLTDVLEDEEFLVSAVMKHQHLSAYGYMRSAQTVGCQHD